MIAIYLILMFQFRSVVDPLVVMAAIPLGLLGASLGLLITGNPFGFTAFLGIVSLGGVVVRNAIILVDYIRDRMEEGVEIEEAAIEAGERRLRPIFLTTMAAAVGVTPMILSGSSMWSPLGSTIAFGLVGSMFFTLIVIPVLYVMIHKRRLGRPGSSEPDCSIAAGCAALLMRSFAARWRMLSLARSRWTRQYRSRRNTTRRSRSPARRSRRWTRAFAKRGRVTSRRCRTIPAPCTSPINSASRSRKAPSACTRRSGPCRARPCRLRRASPISS